MDIMDLDGRIFARLVKMMGLSDEKRRERLISDMSRLTGFSREKSEEAVCVIIQVLEREYPDVFEDSPLN